MNIGANTRFSHDWLINSIRAKYQERTLKELISITTEPMGFTGNNFTSDMERIKVVFKNESKSRQSTVTLIAKMNKPVERDINGEEGLWNNRTEVEVYVDVLDQMENLMSEFNDQRETLWPIIYGHIPYSLLLLEDLGQRYKMLPRTAWLDEEYALLGLRSLARYHAMSKILIHRGHIGEQYKNQFLCGIESPFHEALFKGSLQLLSRAMVDKVGRWKSVESSESWGKRLELLAPTICEKRVETYLNYDERFKVLNHGDFRSSNMMFRTMEYTGHPIAMKFFDYQLPHLNSFAWDVVYFFAVSIDPSFRRAHHIRLLEAYQQTLADNLKMFNFDGYVPTIDDVEKEVNRLALVEFSYMAAVTPVVTSSIDEALYLDKITTHPPEESMNQIVFSEEHFVEGIIGDFERVVKLEII